MPDSPAKDPAGSEKVGKPKKGMLTGKNKWYVVGGLGIVAVLVFFFVSRSSSNAAGTTATTTGGGLDPSTQAALNSALQGQAAGQFGGGGLEGPAGATGPPGPAGKRGKQGKPGKNAPVHHVPHKPPPHKRVGHTTFYTVRPGDSLSKIAQQHHISGGWEQLYHNNRGVVGSNPNTIHPGQRLKI